MASWAAWVALAIALGALVYSWKLSQELETARGRLDRYNRALFQANDEIANLRENVAQELAELRVAGMKAQGAPAFHAEMTLREANLLHAQTEEVLAGFHLGGCSHCAVEPDETLAEACARNGIAAEKLVQALNQLLAEANGQNGDRPVKLPNVQLEL